jgi:serine protease inhibitor ecotin
MIKNLTLALVTALTNSSSFASDAEKDNIHMFPQAQKGFVRYVIEVPVKTQSWSGNVKGKNALKSVELSL